MKSAMLYGLRKVTGSSQTDIAKILNMTRATYLKKENNIEELKLGEVFILLKHYQKRFDDIFGDLY